jgi:hypothetical protein
LSAAMPSTSTAILVAGKLYTGDSVMKAQGSNSDIVGTWVSESHESFSAAPYHKVIYSFSSNKSVSFQLFESTTSIYADAPDSSWSGTYALNSDGTMTITRNNTSNTFFYEIVGSYFLFGDQTSLGAYAFIKQ